MFRRATLTAVAIATVGFLALGGTAPASAQVIRDRFHGQFAEAGWETTTATSITDVGTLASKSQDGTTHLAIFDLQTYLDGSGNVTGSRYVTGELEGASMTFDRVGLNTASANGTLPVTRCTFDAAGDPTGCTDSTLDVSVSWAGEGDIARGNFYEDHALDAGNFVYLDRLSGTFRFANATATIAGQSFDASSLQFADLGVSNQMTLTVCPHGC
jgi:hypothetical protein